MRFYIRRILFVVLSLVLSTTIARAAEITVAAAANLDPVMGRLVSAFNETSSVKVKTVTGASGKFVTQIESGAPFDVLMSADMKYPETLFKEGLATAAPKVYVHGLLVLWTVKSLDLSKGIEVLKNQVVQKIAIASPKVAPYGREAINVIKHYGFYPAVEGKFVYGENMSQANTFVMTGAADIGITAKSTVLSGKVKDTAKWVDIPLESYKPIAQGVVVLVHAKGDSAAAAQDFMDFLFSAKAMAIFKDSGYIAP
ncbi:MAG: molybdate ABC transporter substrate-binding protein [Candidatus Omnitrophica bacterium]|nr:molybdate ABC transporter substrate-binding protein [Candidatus Omnitrophota bacterium]